MKYQGKGNGEMEGFKNIFKNRKVNVGRLLDFGFTESGGKYTYRTELLEGQFVLKLDISREGNIDTEVRDTETGEEYVLIRLPDACGAFVGTVRKACEEILSVIAERCFEKTAFQSVQANELCAYIKNSYGDEPEFLWKKTPENAVFRRRDNARWYAVVLTVAKCKLGFEEEGETEIIDLKASPTEISALIDGKRYFSGYHMNKKHWYTICLDGTVADEELFRRIDESYISAKKG